MTDYEKLKKLIEETDELIRKDITHSDPEFNAWKSKIKRFISKVYGSKSEEMKSFDSTMFISSVPLIGGTSAQSNHNYNAKYCRNGLETTKAILKTYLDDFDDEIPTETHVENQKQADLSKIFIVHGHDGELKLSVKSIIEKQEITPIILSEQANKGRTVIEKFEDNSDVGGAICLFTADDLGKAKDSKEDKPRARQNVVFEAGYFMGKLGRNHVVILSDSGVELPSDLAGVVYTNTRNWQVDLLKELKEMGYKIDLNKLLD